ncbi:MAG: hypothetical protein JOZ43_00440 [Acidobacteriales bacterium]|nr:hypothetical protein [Terriglobales bacterium]
MKSVLIAEPDLVVRAMLADVTGEFFPDVALHLPTCSNEVLALAEVLAPPAIAVLHEGLLRDYTGHCVHKLKLAKVPVILTMNSSMRPPSRLVSQADAILERPFGASDYLEILERSLRWAKG